MQVLRSSFVSCSALGFLCAWGLAQRESGVRLTAVGDEDTLRYLSRMDLFRHLDIEFSETFSRHTEVGRFIPLYLVRNSEEVAGASNAICDLVLHQFDNAGEFLPAMEWAVYEIIDNIVTHSESQVGGVVCAQFYPNRHNLDISICDYGRGIRASLGERIAFDSHGEAISKAMERGITRNPDVGQGNGLAGSHDIVTLNYGGMSIRSGDVELRVRKGQDVGFTSLPVAGGTSVTLRLDPRFPVKLEDTFIQDNAWTFINVECERLFEEGGLKVVDECAHTGGRPPAAALRRKIEALLPEMDDILIVDFEGVSSSSSSFLDELLGRLVLAIGADTFKKKISIANARKEIAAMADVVIQQRLRPIA